MRSITKELALWRFRLFQKAHSCRFVRYLPQLRIAEVRLWTIATNNAACDPPLGGASITL